MFRTAFVQGNASTIQTIGNSAETPTITVCNSHFEYLAFSVAITFLAILVVLVTFNGFWQLGRNVTMSPIGKAKAFNAPLLAQEHTNTEVSEPVKGAGMEPGRYGRLLIRRRVSGQHSTRGRTVDRWIQWSRGSCSLRWLIRRVCRRLGKGESRKDLSQLKLHRQLVGNDSSFQYPSIHHRHHRRHHRPYCHRPAAADSHAHVPYASWCQFSKVC